MGVCLHACFSSFPSLEVVAHSDDRLASHPHLLHLRLLIHMPSALLQMEFAADLVQALPKSLDPVLLSFHCLEVVWPEDVS